MVAPAVTGKTAPPIPHISVPGEVTEPTVAPPPPPKRKLRLSPVMMVSVGVGLLVLAVGGYVLVKKLTAPPPPPPPVVVKPKPPAALAAKPAVAAAAAPLAPSETPNTVAHAPIDSIAKMKDAIVAHRANEQARVDAAAVGEEPSEKKPAAPSKPVATSSTIAPGISATNMNVEAVSEATPAFRSFVANAKISGVIQSTPPRAVINNRLTRAGEMVDTGLGVTFEGIDADKRQLIFKDKAGATVTRRY